MHVVHILVEAVGWLTLVGVLMAGALIVGALAFFGWLILHGLGKAGSWWLG